MIAHRPTIAEIDLGAFRANLDRVRALVGTRVKIIAVVKADAYGHGMQPCAREAIAWGAEMLAVATVDEALTLRETKGFSKPPILLMGPSFPDDARDLAKARISVAVGNRELLEANLAECRRDGKPGRIHLKIDTGMGRYGFAPGEAVEIIGGLGRDAAHLEGLMSHYSVSDSGKPADQEFTQQQTRRLRIIANANKSMGLSFFTHAANSGAVLHHPDAHFDAVRPGVMLYGTHPDPAVVDETLRQVMSLKTRVVSIHPHAAGDPIGYGRTYTMPHDGRVGLLPIGYGDGLPRSLGNRARVLIRGKRVPIIGRVCMDQVMIDLTGVDGVEVGEEVVLYGAQGSERIGIEEAASIAGTITYEITCQVGKRVPRRWLNPSPSSVG